MTREEGKEFANALKNNYTIDFDKIPDFCDLVISALEKNESAEEWYKLLCEKWDSADNKWIPVSERLPDNNVRVLCSAISTSISGGYTRFVGCCNNGFWFVQTDSETVSYPRQYEVTAWMSLPEPMKVGE